MELYAGIDLHSTTNHIGIIDEQDRRVYRKKLANDPTRIFEAFKKNLKGVVVESTFNWYWLVDILMEHERWDARGILTFEITLDF